ncbi:CBF/Mak21 family-domain-containing protein [Geopyxis carbonaria]|nr:CBF/Mak21 family-domain-containing protein [Geopyxis carbonaria]
MAKKHNSKPDGATPAAPGGDGVPVFSADALSKLTQRIQTGFDKNNDKGAQKKSGKKDKKQAKAKEPQSDRKPPAAKPVVSKPVVAKPVVAKPVVLTGKPDKSRNEKHKSKNHSEFAAQPAQRGKNNGRLDIRDKPQRTFPVALPQQKNSKRADSRPATNGTSKPTVSLPRKTGTNRIDKEALLKEIVELGGTKEDLDLVAGIESDDEGEEVVVKDSGKVNAVKAKDIEAFMKGIGLEAGKVGDIEESEEEDEDEDEDEEEDEEEGEEESADDGDESLGEDDDDEDEEEDVEMEDFAPLPPRDPKGGKLLFPKRPDWHAEPLPPLPLQEEEPSAQVVHKLHSRGKALLKEENEIYSATHLVKSSDRQFLSQIMQSGTLSDKISALTLVCQESPLHTMKTLENLLGLARKKSRSQTVQALAAIKDLFAQGVCLPPNRKLRYFAKQPGLGAKGTRDIHLVAWAYEDWLKHFYFEVLKTLEQLCTDQLVYARNHAVGYVYEMLKEKPEQEANLLRVLVNKLGDTDKKITSKVSFLLLQLQNAHPAMKNIIINAIEQEVIFRSGNSIHAQYYAIITLNQTVLSKSDYDVANKLLDIYFSVFAPLIKRDAPATPATGVNATGKGKHIKMGDKPDKMNRKAKARAEAAEKKTQFDEEVNAKLISAVLTGVNRAFPFSKVDDDVFEKHMDTLFRITHNGNFNTSIQALMLIYQVSSSKQTVSDRFYRTLYESLLDQRLVNSSKQALYLNLLFRALKADTSVKRVKAFVKRILQSATFHQPSFICGVLYLLSELEVAIPAIRALFTDPEPNEDDEEEVFLDAPDSDAEDAPAAPAPKPTKALPTYDGRKRDPLHANADLSCAWEILSFVNHFHPTIALFATCLLEKRPMPSKPDLGMHTLSHFLDRFVYRNPKAAPTTTRGTSIMQPLAGAPSSMGMVLATRDKKGAVPLNSDAFWRRRVEDVRPEEVFFHNYFNMTQPKSKKPKEDNKRKREDDDESDSEVEGEVWKALVDSRPELEGGDDGGSVDFDDDDEDLVMSDDDDSDAGPDLDDDDAEEWNTDDDDAADSDDEAGEESEPVPGDMAAMFEAQIAKATAKRAKTLATDESGDEEAEREVEVREKDGSRKKQKLKHLPTFASMEDYADMLSDSE